MIYTYQDYEKAIAGNNLGKFVAEVIRWHKGTELYKNALEADEYDAERNVTILNFLKWVFTGTGMKVPDTTSSNTKITSNFFARLNSQRCLYSLGNGFTFQVKNVGKKLGADADKTVKDGAYYGLIHGVSFLYWAYDHIHLFKITEFAPLYDEKTGALGAGVRFWQLTSDRPLYATLYTQDGYMDFVSESGNYGELKPVDGEMNAYRVKIQKATPTTGEIVTAHNYGSIPIVPLWGSRLHQSTLVGMQSKIDTFDIIFSGFANDLQECAQIYWIISGAAGMNEKDISEFRNRLLYRHMASIKQDGAEIKPHTQEVPYNARKELLTSLRSQLYEDFGGLDVHTVAAGATNDHIEAAYQPLDEQADDFEYQVIDAIRQLLSLQGVSAEDATPQFKRNKISNQREWTEMVLMAANYLDDEAILDKLPFLTPEEKEAILERKAAEELARTEPIQEPTEPEVPPTEVIENA